MNKANHNFFHILLHRRIVGYMAWLLFGYMFFLFAKGEFMFGKLYIPVFVISFMTLLQGGIIYIFKKNHRNYLLPKETVNKRDMVFAIMLIVILSLVVRLQYANA